MSTSERISIVPKWAGLVFAAAVFAILVFGYLAQGFGGPPQTLVISFVVAGIVALIQTNENLRGHCDRKSLGCTRRRASCRRGRGWLLLRPKERGHLVSSAGETPALL